MERHTHAEISAILGIIPAMDYHAEHELPHGMLAPSVHAEKENEREKEDESLTVTVPSNAAIARLGQVVRWKQLSVLVNNVRFDVPRSRLVNVFRSFGLLKLEHVPRHLPRRHDSHRGFGVFTYGTAHHTQAALSDAPALLAEAGCQGVKLRRLGDYPQYRKYCKGVDVAAVMRGACPATEALLPRGKRERCLAVKAVEEEVRLSKSSREDVRAFLTRRRHHQVGRV